LLTASAPSVPGTSSCRNFARPVRPGTAQSLQRTRAAIVRSSSPRAFRWWSDDADKVWRTPGWKAAETGAPPRGSRPAASAAESVEAGHGEHGAVAAPYQAVHAPYG